MSPSPNYSNLTNFCHQGSRPACPKLDLDLGRIAFYSNNRISGIAWKCLIGGGFIVGSLDPGTERFTGSHVTYIYPDRQTTLCGKFESKF